MKDNKCNTLYFESPSMSTLYKCIQIWQDENKKRLLSISIQKDGDNFCCIALTNPTEVVITSEDGENHADICIDHKGVRALSVYEDYTR